METNIWQPSDEALAVKSILAGELVAFPTETVYGLGADATNEEAVKQVYVAKGRPSDNPLIVHVASQADVTKYVSNIPEQARQLIEAFWPGPLTLVFQAKKNTLAPTVTGHLDTVAIRMPNHPVALSLIENAQVPIVGPSANTSGKPSPTSSKHVYQDLYGKIAGILDGGPTQVGLESTVIDVSQSDQITILRPGIVSKQEIEAVIGPVTEDSHLSNPQAMPKAPGMKYKHYAPNEPVVLIQPEDWAQAIVYYQKQGEKIGLLATNSILLKFREKVAAVYDLGVEGDIESAGQKLYAGLRFFSATPATIILAEAFPKRDVGVALMNRLEKAAGNHYFKNEY